jgi:hypothetical protein
LAQIAQEKRKTKKKERKRSEKRGGAVTRGKSESERE